MQSRVFREIKKEIRILGIDDGPFDKFKDKKADLIGVVYRGGTYIDGVLKREIEVDGDDATDKIVEMILQTRHKGHLRVVMLSGITFGGLNIVDAIELNDKTNLPVIIVTRKVPDIESMKKAISNVKNKEAKTKRLLAAGDFHKIHVNKKEVVIQKIDISLEDATEIISVSTVRGAIPEPLRIPHLIASGIKTGDSTGRA